MSRANTAEKTKKIQRLQLVKNANRKTVHVAYLRLVIFGAVFCTVIALSYVIQYSLYNQYSLENDRLKKIVESNKQTGQELRGKVLSLRSPLRIESIAKNKLKMVKPSEVNYLVYEVERQNMKLAFKR